MSLLFKGSDEIGRVPRGPWPTRLGAWLVDHLRQMVGSLGELWRTPISSVLTMAALGLALSLPTALYVLYKNVAAVADAWQESTEITLFLRKDLSDPLQQAVAHRLSLQPEIAHVTYLSPAKALAEFQSMADFGEALQYLDQNPLPATVVVIPAEEHRTPEAAKALLEKLEQASEVSFGRMDLEWVKRLHGVLALVRDAFAAVTCLLLITVLLTVGNTIRLAILAKRDAIEVMKLVGATDGFIQRPFLYTGWWFGIIGAFIALVAVSSALYYLESALSALSGLYSSQLTIIGLDLAEAGGVILIAIALGLSGAFISVRRHIAEIEPR
ncbi:MAG: permease-like cell division protein FtsX [Gammaproteobacteria bacterium]|nr:permease-like cell division protein FtsX [Gammaproteobacteria bacterium]